MNNTLGGEGGAGMEQKKEGWCVYVCVEGAGGVL